jgi:catechol 2,3-dioxygenase-like lactoylglutathione lyase family enzyme
MRNRLPSSDLTGRRPTWARANNRTELEALLFLGLRTAIYHVDDLRKAKEWYSDLLGVEPYFDDPFYVGFKVGGYELGLDPEVAGVLAATAKIAAGITNLARAVWREDSLRLIRSGGVGTASPARILPLPGRGDKRDFAQNRHVLNPGMPRPSRG